MMVGFFFKKQDKKRKQTLWDVRLPDEFHQALLQVDFGAVQVVQLGGRP